MREPTPTGGGVCHSTESMLTYHSGAFVGSPANDATAATGRRITVSVSTSTSLLMRAWSRAVGGRSTRLDRHVQQLPHLDLVRVPEPAGRRGRGHGRAGRRGDRA